MIYKEFKTWKAVGRLYVRRLLNGFYGLFYFCLIVGMISVVYAVIRRINAFYRRETMAACIISVLFLLMGLGWIATFVRERAACVKAQHVADSLSYDLSKFTQMYDSTEELVKTDTVSICK